MDIASESPCPVPSDWVQTMGGPGRSWRLEDREDQAAYFLHALSANRAWLVDPTSGELPPVALMPEPCSFRPRGANRFPLMTALECTSFLIAFSLDL